MSERIWSCKIGGDAGELPDGCDRPMREAIAKAYQAITGREPEFIFSGWAAQLTESERAVVENREPRTEFWCKHCKQSTVPPEQCISTGCQKPAVGASVLCQEHYDALPSAMRGENGSGSTP